MKFLEEDKEFFNEYYKMTLDYLCGTKKSLNLLDADTVKALMDQEAAIMKDIDTEAKALAADGIDEDADE